MGMGGSLFYAPSIPPRKEYNARAAHALHLPEEEPVLALYDDTLFGGAEDGFLITTERLCWKNIWEYPRQITWNELDPASISPGGGQVNLSGGQVNLDFDLTAGLAAFLIEMAARRRTPAIGPYRDAAPIAETPEAGALKGDRLISLARMYIGEFPDIFYHPSIPWSKSGRARSAHEAHLPENEPVAVLYDDTVFGSGEEGFLLTSRRLCWKNFSEEPTQLSWGEIEPSTIETRRNHVRIMNGAIQITGQPSLVPAVAKLLRAAAEEARRGTGI